jgi:Rrf2 family protein
MLSSRARYALSALTYLAKNPGRPRPAQRIAAITGAPLPTLSKILQSLGRAGLIRTTRGPKGGVCLTCDAAHVTVWDVIHAVDGDPSMRWLRSEAIGPCLYRRLDLLRRIAELVLNQTTLAELAGQPPDESARPALRAIEESLSRALDAQAGSGAVPMALDPLRTTPCACRSEARVPTERSS